MPALFDKTLTLNWPLVIPPEQPGGDATVVYFSNLVLYGIDYSVCVFDLVRPPAATVIHPHGTQARVVGIRKFIYRTIFVDGSNVVPCSTPSPSSGLETTNLLWPALVMGCVVSSGILASLQPHLTVQDVTVRRQAEMFGAPVTIRCGCRIDAGQSVVAAAPGTPAAVVISGRLVAFNDASLTLEVDRVKLVGTRRSNIVAAVAAEVRQWLARVARAILETEMVSMMTPDEDFRVIRLEPETSPRFTLDPAVPRIVLSVHRVPRLPRD